MLKADLFAIEPVSPYSKKDINWMNPLSRCNREKVANKDVPIKNKMNHFMTYDTILIGFPIWYGTAPNVVQSFCKDYDWKGKKIYLFATSGGSGMGKTQAKLVPYLKGADVISDHLVTSSSDL